MSKAHCCDCVCGGPCCSWEENESCQHRQDEGACWKPYTKGEANMDKPLKDWTLGEVKEFCNGNDCYAGCALAKSPGKCKILYEAPCSWDLAEKPRWTEREVTDAKTLCRMWPNGEIKFKRDTDGRCAMVQIQGSLHGCLDLGKVSLFPSIKPGQSVLLSEIVGGVRNERSDS